ncbi:MAG: protein kinase [Cryobacterium sp.]|nr:protein kinase [Cryobacterium sp.]
MELVYERKIGAGAGGEVWLATDALQRRCAVKFFFAHDPTLKLALAFQHAEALCRIDHRTVVRVYVFEEQPHPERATAEWALIMEYCNGPTLAAFEGVIDRPHAEAILRDLAEAVEAFHAQKRSHGDLYDKNVIVTASGARVFDPYASFSGTGSSGSTRMDDIRSLANLFCQVLARVSGISNTALENAVAQSASAASVEDVRRAFQGLAPSLAPPARRRVHPNEEFTPRDALTSPGAIKRAQSGAMDRTLWSPDGGTLALWSSADLAGQVFLLCDPSHLKIRAGIDFEKEGSFGTTFDRVDFSRGSSLVGLSCGQRLAVLRATDGAPLLAYDWPVLYKQLELSPDGGSVAWASVFGTVAIGATDGSTRRRTQLHMGAASQAVTLAWSPTSERLVVAADGFSLQLWDRSGDVVLQQVPFVDEIHSLAVAWAVDGSCFAVSNGRGALAVRDGESGFWQDGQDLLDGGDGDEGARSLGFSNDFLIVAGPGAFQVWDRKSWRLSLRVAISTLSADSSRVEVSPDARRVAVFGRDQVVVFREGNANGLRFDLSGSTISAVGWRENQLWLVRDSASLVVIEDDNVSEFRVPGLIRHVSLGPSLSIAVNDGIMLWEPTQEDARIARIATSSCIELDVGAAPPEALPVQTSANVRLSVVGPE